MNMCTDVHLMVALKQFFAALALFAPSREVVEVESEQQRSYLPEQAHDACPEPAGGFANVGFCAGLAFFREQECAV